MKARFIFLLCVIVIVGLPFLQLRGQSGEPAPETDAAGMVVLADSIKDFDPTQYLKVLEEALAQTEKDKSDSLKAHIEYRLTRAYMNKGYYNSGLRAGYSALRYFESVGDSSYMGKAKHRIAIIHLENGNTELSRQYDTEALTLLDPATDSSMIGRTYMGLGNYWDYMDNQDSALFYYHKALDIAKAIGELQLTHYCYNNIALVYQDLEDYAQTLQYFEMALAITKLRKDFGATAFLLNNVGTMYFRKGNVSKALEYSEQAYGMAIEHQTASGLVNIHGTLAKAHSASGNWEKAFFHQKEYTGLIESYFNEKSAAYMADMESKYQNEQKQAKIAFLNKENEYKEIQLDRQDTIQNLMIIGIALLLILVGGFVLAYRDKQKTNRLLAAQQEEIKRINADLEVKVQERTDALANVNTELNDLLYRTSHDLRTPITKLMGLVGLAKANAMPAETVLEHIDTTMEQLNQQNLSFCEIGILRHYDLKPGPLELREGLEEAVAEVRTIPACEGALIELDIPAELPCNFDLYLFKIALREVLSNAVIFGGGPGSKVFVSGQRVGKQLEVSVQDSGPGVPKEIRENLFDLFVKGTNDPKHFGLGLYKARLAVERMGGSIQYKPSSESGSTFEINIPG